MKSVFAGVRKSGLQVVTLEKKDQVRKTLLDLGQKCFEKNYRVKRGKERFLKTKKALVKICNMSHLLSCKLPHKFIFPGFLEIPNCQPVWFYFATPIILEAAIDALSLIVLYPQIGQT